MTCSTSAHQQSPQVALQGSGGAPVPQIETIYFQQQLGATSGLSAEGISEACSNVSLF